MIYITEKADHVAEVFFHLNRVPPNTPYLTAEVETLPRDGCQLKTDVSAGRIWTQPVQTGAEIAQLKALLAASDYAVIKIAEGAAERETYAPLLQCRQQWRSRIRALEGQK